MHAWPEVSCVILSSEIEERVHDPQSPPEFRHDISYGYEWQGVPRTGDHLTLRGSPWSSKRDLVASRAAEFPAGKTTTCRVDPANPDIVRVETGFAGTGIFDLVSRVVRDRRPGNFPRARCCAGSRIPEHHGAGFPSSESRP